MANLQNFRSALNGFNREDVVHYIEYLNNKHNSQVNQLKTELQTVRSELALVRPAPVQADLEVQLEQANVRCAALEAEIAQLRSELEKQPAPHAPSNEELEAYRRAERAERMAQERAAQLCAQANGVLADATVKVDEAAAQVCAMADHVTAQLGQLQVAVSSSKAALRDAASAMYAIRPVDSKE